MKKLYTTLSAALALSSLAGVGQVNSANAENQCLEEFGQCIEDSRAFILDDVWNACLAYIPEDPVYNKVGDLTNPDFVGCLEMFGPAYRQMIDECNVNVCDCLLDQGYGCGGSGGS